MKRLLIALALLAVIAAGGLYYYFSGKEYVFEFTQAQLQEKLSAKMPISRRYLLIFEVTLDNPRVALIESLDRVAAGLDVTLNIYVNDSPIPLGGTLDVSGSIRYDAELAAFFLSDPEIERLQVQGVPQQYSAKVTQVLTRALAEYYQSHPVYTLSRTNAKQAAARLVLKDVQVRGQSLFVTLGI
ncbi:MAG: DUF1439 domain-containing protein [Xanthomonadales bacterium]|nr:DUF1439 domain-containing protein [Xanthomonadales bacterium]